MTTLHPTGSEYLAAMLAELGRPAPWRLADEDCGCVLDANGGEAFTVDTLNAMSDEDATRLALLILCGINTLAGFVAEFPGPKSDG